MDIRSVAKVVIFSLEEHKLLLIRRSATDTKRPSQWDFPGGMVECGETLEAAAVRECQEEVGILIDQTKLDLIYTDRNYFDDRQPTLVNWLIFTAIIPEQNISLSSEHDQYLWTTINEGLSMLTYERYKAVLAFFNEHEFFSSKQQ